jgi:hypothetical protein
MRPPSKSETTPLKPKEDLNGPPVNRSHNWKNPNDITRILCIEEVLVTLVKEFNGHEVTTFHPQVDLVGTNT